MVDAEPGTLATIVVVTVSVLSFVSTSAMGRIEKFENVHIQFFASTSLVFSYGLLFQLGIIVFSSGAFSDVPAVFSGLKVVFAAFIVPTTLITMGHIEKVQHFWNHEELHKGTALIGLIVLLGIYFGLLNIPPS